MLHLSAPLALVERRPVGLDVDRRFFNRPQAGCRSELGDNHPDTVTAIDTLSQLLSDLGKLEDALPLKRESLRVRTACEPQAEPVRPPWPCGSAPEP